MRQVMQKAWPSLNTSDEITTLVSSVSSQWTSPISQSNLDLQKVLNVVLKLTSAVWFTVVRCQTTTLEYNNKPQAKQPAKPNNTRWLSSGPRTSGPSPEWLQNLSLLTHQGPRRPLAWGIILFTVVCVILCGASLELPVPPGSLSLHH